MKKCLKNIVLSSEYEKVYRRLRIVEMKEIEDITGCLKPCSYKRYSFVRDDQPIGVDTEHFFLGFWSVTKETFVEKELLIYPLTSLVAEFGGTLGLFLGFSFMTLWDGLQIIHSYVRK